MNILCVIDSLGAGGAQRQLVGLARGFVARGHIVEFLVYHRRDFFKPILEQENISINYITEMNYLRRLLKMRRFIRNGEFDVVLSFLQASNFISEIASLPTGKWKLIVGERSANPNISSSVKLRTFRLFHFLADFVVSNSNANLDIVQSVNPFLKNSKCKVIYNLVPSSYFSKSINENPNISNELKIVIGASHRYLKNSKGLVQALLMLSPSQRSRLKVSWYGDRIHGPFFDGSFSESNELVKKHSLEQCLRFYPATDKFVDYISDADVVALFSFYEGLPNTICEAMALGKPVMVSNVSDMNSLLAHNLNQTFDPVDVDSIKNTFEYYLNLEPSEFLKIGLANRRVALDKFSEENIISNYLELFS